MAPPRPRFILLSDEVPGFLRVRYYTFIAVSFIPGAVLLVLALFDADRGWPLLAVIAVFPPLFALLIWERRRMLAVIERGRQGKPLCWTCGYDLVSTPSPGACPECGAPFNTETLLAQWQRVPLH